MRLINHIKSAFVFIKKTKNTIEIYDKNSPYFMNNNPKFHEFQIGEWTYGNPIIRKGDSTTRLEIGKYCSIASGVQILLGGEHRKDWVTTYPFNVIFPEAKSIEGHPASKGDISIGNDVWIGLNAIILSGVQIGNGAIVGAGSVIVKNVPAYSIVAGNPSRVLGFRFPIEIIEELEKIQWWNWSHDKVVEALPLLLNDSIENFISKYSA